MEHVTVFARFPQLKVTEKIVDLRIVEESEMVMIIYKKFGVWKKVYKKMQRVDFTLVFGGVDH